MSPSTKRCLAFTATCALSAALAWIAGYDFDERGIGPASWFGATIFAALIAAACPIFDNA